MRGLFEMKQEFNCSKCESRFHCNDRDYVEEALSKMETREDNTYNPGSFIYLMRCSNYKYDENIL